MLGLFVAVMLVVGRRVIPWILERIAGTGSRELFTLRRAGDRAGRGVRLGRCCSACRSRWARFSPACCSTNPNSATRPPNDSLPLRDAFAVLFFVSVGMLFNPAILIEHPWQVLATAAIIMFGKSAAAFVIVRALRPPDPVPR